MLAIFSWIVTLFALYGTWLNVQQDRRGFIYWIIADACFVTLFIKDEMWPQALLFSVYTYLAVRGFYKWGEVK